jgi:hypothetical protein
MVDEGVLVSKAKEAIAGDREGVVSVLEIKCC